MQTKMFIAMACLGFSALAWADPAYQVDTKIVREYEENGESKRVEFTPNFRLSTGADGQLRINDQTLAAPALPDPDAQKAFTAMMQMFANQAAPLMSQFSKGQPFQMILEVPTMHEKLNIEMRPHRDE